MSNGDVSPDKGKQTAPGSTSKTVCPVSLSAPHSDPAMSLLAEQLNQGTMSFAVHTLSTLLSMQAVEEHKPKTSKVSWLPDILVFRASIIPTILTPVLAITLWAAAVAGISVWWGKEVGLRNDIVPLLSVVVGLLLVFRNSSAYERYSVGRKDFTTLISNARNLSRLIWVFICLPTSTDTPSTITRDQLTHEKRELIRLVVAFVIATKHHLRDEGGVHHDDLRGLLPRRLRMGGLKEFNNPPLPFHDFADSPTQINSALPTPSGLEGLDEESALGMISPRTVRHKISASSMGLGSNASRASRSSAADPSKSPDRPKLTHRSRRPSAVRVALTPSDGLGAQMRQVEGMPPVTEQTPLISQGVRPHIAKTVSDIRPAMSTIKNAHAGLGRMVELGLPLIIANDLTRSIFRYRRLGYLETVGPAGVNSMQALVQSMIDQLGSMERVVQTPMPYIVAVHMKQATTLLLLILPFVLVDTLKLKMIPLMFCIALIYMGIEGIAAQVEQPFGTDPCDLNLDLFCTELLCECEALLERLPEGDEDENDAGGVGMDNWETTNPLDHRLDHTLMADDDGGD